jgi:hypothetical protein
MSQRLFASLACLVGLASALTAAPTSAAASDDISYPAAEAGPAVVPTVGNCVVNAADFLVGRSSADDTAGVAAAMADASAEHPGCFPRGPSGAPQAVVYLPPRVYRLASLFFPSNLRMEVDAGAVLQLPANRPAVPSTVTTAMIYWDSKGLQPPVRNVSIVGVGTDLDARKAAVLSQDDGALAPFDISHDFTMNLDPASTGSSNYNPGMNIANAEYFRIENFFSVQNGTPQAASAITAWPTSGRPVLQLHARANSPVGPGPYLQPEYGTVVNQINVGSPRGYGPNQVNAGSYLTFRNIYSRGGTALRLETDGSTTASGRPEQGATVEHLVGRTIVGVNCNRAVALTPHAQVNADIDVSGVWSYSCGQAVVANSDAKVAAQYEGRFDFARVADVHAFAGDSSQLDSTTSLWVVGRSLCPVTVEAGVTWNPQIDVVQAVGAFKRR